MPVLIKGTGGGGTKITGTKRTGLAETAIAAGKFVKASKGDRFDERQLTIGYTPTSCVFDAFCLSMGSDDGVTKRWRIYPFVDGKFGTTTKEGTFTVGVRSGQYSPLKAVGLDAAIYVVAASFESGSGEIGGCQAVKLTCDGNTVTPALGAVFGRNLRAHNNTFLFKMDCGRLFYFDTGVTSGGSMVSIIVYEINYTGSTPTATQVGEFTQGTGGGAKYPIGVVKYSNTKYFFPIYSGAGYGIMIDASGTVATMSTIAYSGGLSSDPSNSTGGVGIVEGDIMYAITSISGVPYYEVFNMSTQTVVSKKKLSDELGYGMGYKTFGTFQFDSNCFGAICHEINGTLSHLVLVNIRTGKITDKIPQMTTSANSTYNRTYDSVLARADGIPLVNIDKGATYGGSWMWLSTMFKCAESVMPGDSNIIGVALKAANAGQTFEYMGV